MLTIAAGQELAPFSSFDFSGGVVAAVSGGSDSVALLLLLKSHLDRHYPDARLLAVTVDHALRPDSAAEAEGVARLCESRGIAHRTIVWRGPKPSAGIPAAAREARYHLLAQAGHEAGLSIVATGHTADDQAETIWMRQARGSDADALGLAGMAPATLREGRVWIVRPLLEIRRATLRDLLRNADVGWIDDPTNSDRRFERPRLRAAGNDDRMAEALSTARRAARARLDLNSRAGKLVQALADMPVPGLVRLGRKFVNASDRDAALHALRLLLAVTGGNMFPPSRDRVDDLLARLSTGRRMRATLSRCVIDSRGTGIFLHREARDLPPAGRAAAGQVWDGRRRIKLSAIKPSLIVAPRGEEAVGKIAALPAEVPESIAAAALAAEPVLLDGETGLLATESRQRGWCEPVMAPWHLFLSCFDLTLARAISKMVGAPAIPDPPLSGPIAVGPCVNA